MIVEGLFARHDTLKDMGDVKVFVDIGFHGRILRRLMRDAQRTSRKPADILKYCTEVVEQMYEQYVARSRRNAAQVITNEYAKEVEADKTGMFEVQVKFSASSGIDEEYFRKRGAERIVAVVHEDTYYTSGFWDSAVRGEALRIRKENDRVIFGYKGPKKPDSYRKRSKFEFEIDAETEKEFLGRYRVNAKLIVKKKREVYSFNGIVICWDRDVRKTQDGKEILLGDFVEIRLAVSNPIEGETIIKETAEGLGLNIQEAILTPYSEMGEKANLRQIQICINISLLPPSFRS